VLRFYNRRLVALAQRKIAAGTYGARNAGWRLLVPGFAPEPSTLKLLARGLRRWLVAELRSVFSPRRRTGESQVVSPSVAGEIV
jgi:hypothetical protein